MPSKRNRNRKKRSSVKKTNNTSSCETKLNCKQVEPLKVTPSKKSHDIDDTTSETETASSCGVLTPEKPEPKLPIASRTKSVSFPLRSQENINKVLRLDSMKKQPQRDDNCKDASTDDDDPEQARLIRKIAYCRVFTNYLFRQFDMLTIDFQLNSNLDELMMQLNKRVGIYNAIRRSRKQMLLGGNNSKK